MNSFMNYANHQLTAEQLSQR